MAVDIPNSVTKIGESAFNECIGLKSIVIPKGVTKIWERTFRECNLPESVKKELAVKSGSFIFDEYYK